MKKQFFYAAMAIAMMASCTSEDSPVVDPITPDAEDKVAIKLGIDAPAVNATVGGRGTGAVGDVEGENNVWNSQKLYITMIDNKTGDVAEDENGEIMAYDQFTYVAPRKSDQAEGSYGKGNIRIYTDEVPGGGTIYDDVTDKGTIQHLYYPVQGTFDFYGWHLDDANAAKPAIEAQAATADAASTTSIAINDITIDGTQDIMGAKTVEPEDVPADLEDWLYSARTARNEIDPTLVFEHKLARLKFFVRAGSYSAALHDEDGELKTAPEGVNDATATGAMYVEGITALQLHSKFNMTLNNAGITTGEPSTPIDFVLGSKLAAAGVEGTPDEGKKAGEIGKLVPVAPNYHKDYSTNEQKEAQVGESIMFLPVDGEGNAEGTSQSLTFKLDLMQYVQLTEDEVDSSKDTYDYKRQSSNVTVKASHVKLDGVAQTKFEAGKSYNIYITIYGFERIEVSAELTPWEMGGDVDVDIEEGTSQETTTTETTFNITGLTGTETATVTLNNGLKKTFTNGGEAVKFNVNKGVSYTYTVTAEGYETVKGELSATETAQAHTEEVAMTEAQEPVAPETITATINVSGLAAGVEATVVLGNNEPVKKAADSEGKATFTFAVNKNQEYTYTVTADGYTVQTGDGKIEASTENVTENVVMESAQSQEPDETKDVTITSADTTEYTEVELTVTDKDGNEVELKEGETNVYVLTIGEEYTITLTGKDAQGADVSNETQVTINNETSHISISFENAGSGEEGGE